LELRVLHIADRLQPDTFHVEAQPDVAEHVDHQVLVHRVALPDRQSSGVPKIRAHVFKLLSRLKKTPARAPKRNEGVDAAVNHGHVVWEERGV
jgi:hypothetical protein